MNPEFYTVWNFRREIIQRLSNSLSPEEIKSLYQSELKFGTQVIVMNPKSYWIWFHRIWLTTAISKSQLPQVQDSLIEMWKREFEQCGKLLNMDERNFHCWDYRRFVAKNLQATIEQEFKFTTEKIEKNFSNYSAWHQRSALLPLQYPDKTSFQQALDREFELVQNAFYTEPSDSSAWFYHRWLIQNACSTPIGEKLPENEEAIVKRELQMCQELLKLEPKCKWAILTSCFLLLRLGGPTKQIEENSKNLIETDPYRANYYKDQFLSN